MSASSDHELVARLGQMADPLGGADWSDVERRARRSRMRTGALVLAVLAALAVALPASGLDSRLVSWLDVSSGPAVVPPPAERAPVTYVYGDGLYRGGTRIAHLRVPLRAPLLGTELPLAISSPDGRYLVYHAWEGRPSLGAPTLRIYDRRTGRDRLLERGAQSFAWQRGVGLAYMRATEPVYRGSQPRGLPGGYYGQVVVRRSLGAKAVQWTDGPPGIYVVQGWAGNELLVTSRPANLVPRTGLPAGLYALAGPHRARRLPGGFSALSPDGQRIVGAAAELGTGHPQVLRVIRVRDGRVLASLPIGEVGRILGARGEQVFVGGVGAWAGDRVVLSTQDALVVLRVGPRSLAVDRVLRLDLALTASRFRGGFPSAAVFVGPRTVAVRVDAVERDDQIPFSLFATCNVETRTCVGGRRLAPARRFGAVVQNPSRPR